MRLLHEVFRRRFFCIGLALIVIACAHRLPGQAEPPTDIAIRKQIDEIVNRALASSNVPSISIAVVKNDHVFYVQAYGKARLEPQIAARPEMRYSIGSTSKQFTATAILMLAEEGKLTLDDRVSRFLPTLTRANEVTIRQLLSHTAGYQDYWPQDYAPVFMQQPTSAEEILNGWARKPLDFDPGAKWQYSNTNYVIAGVIVERASGQSLIQFLRNRVFTPLGMSTVADVDQSFLPDSDPTGYIHYALAPLRIAPKESHGWLFSAGGLAMSAEDLAKWDISVLNQRLLRPSSYKDMESEVNLRNGNATGYGLGLWVGEKEGHRMLEHGGAVSGFSSDNVVFPDDHIAVSVLINQHLAPVAGEITHKIAHLLLADDDQTRKQTDALRIFEDLQHGRIDRARFTADANNYFNPQVLQDYADSLGPLGTPIEFALRWKTTGGGMVDRRYIVKFPHIKVAVGIREMPDGKIEEYQVTAEE